MTVDLPVEKPMTLARERFERIYKTIRDRICLLEYEPGARLGEEELAREFGLTGARRILDLAKSRGLPMTWFVPGFTIDSERNEMLRKQSPQNRVQSRIDRLLCLGSTQALDIRLLGTEPFSGQDFPSDHFGILARLSRQI